MNQKDFSQILERYRTGKATPQEEKMIDEWYEAMGKQPSGSFSSREEKELEKAYWLSIVDHIKPRSENVEVKVSAGNSRKLLWPAIGIAASVLLAIGSFIFLVNRDLPAMQESARNNETDAQEWKQITNSSGFVQDVILPDGSKVALKPESGIRLSPDFNKAEREIRLEGEAFFDVVRNEQKPFIVYANDVTTKVLGTSFTIKAFKGDKNVVVAVRTGKVSVYTKTQEHASINDAIILTPNQEIVFDKQEEKISRRIVEKPQPILPATELERMRFEDAPVKEIFEAIEKIYGVDIEFDEALFSNCTLTTSVSDGDLYNRLNIITDAIGASLTLEENRIIISGEGCD